MLMRVPMLLCGLLAVAGLAHAQSAAPPLAPDTTTLYAHNADGSDELVGWSNTLEDDGDDVAMGPSATCETHTGTDLDFTAVPPSTEIDRLYQLPLRPMQEGTLVLDGEGTISAVLHIGAGGCYGDVEVTARLVADGAVAAEGTASHQYNDADAAYPSVQIDMTPTATEVDMATLVWEVHVTGMTGGQLFMSVSEDRGRTRIDLPVVDVQAGLQTVFHDVHTEDLTVTLDLENTTASHQYNWSMGPEEAVLFAQGALDAGNLTVAVRDAANMTVYEAEFSEAVNATEQWTAGAGNWTVWVNATMATGNVSLIIGPPEPSGTGSQTSGTSATSDATTSDTDGAAGNATDDGEDSPAWAVGAVVATVFAFAAVRRRR